MIFLLAGLIVLGALLYWGGKGRNGADLRKTLVTTGTVILFAGAALMLVMKRFGAAIPLVMMGIFLLRLRSSAPAATPPSAPRMSRTEALEVLGLHEGATRDEIIAAHKRLMKAAHPDQGGSDWLASRINAARDLLLGP